MMAIHISESEVYSRIVSVATSIRNQLVIRLCSGCWLASLVSVLCHSYWKVFVNPLGRLIAFPIIRLQWVAVAYQDTSSGSGFLLSSPLHVSIAWWRFLWNTELPCTLKSGYCLGVCRRNFLLFSNTVLHFLLLLPWFLHFALVWGSFFSFFLEVKFIPESWLLLRRFCELISPLEFQIGVLSANSYKFIKQDLQ